MAHSQQVQSVQRGSEEPGMGQPCQSEADKQRLKRLETAADAIKPGTVIPASLKRKLQLLLTFAFGGLAYVYYPGSQRELGQDPRSNITLPDVNSQRQITEHALASWLSMQALSLLLMSSAFLLLLQYSPYLKRSISNIYRNHS